MESKKEMLRSSRPGSYYRQGFVQLLHRADRARKSCAALSYVAAKEAGALQPALQCFLFFLVEPLLLYTQGCGRLGAAESSQASATQATCAETESPAL